MEYFSRFEPSLFTSAPVIDAFTGERVSAANNGYSDGEYTWYKAEMYYFEHYGLRLRKDFIEHVIRTVRQIDQSHWQWEKETRSFPFSCCFSYAFVIHILCAHRQPEPAICIPSLSHILRQPSPPEGLFCCLSTPAAPCTPFILQKVYQWGETRSSFLLP